MPTIIEFIPKESSSTEKPFGNNPGLNASSFFTEALVTKFEKAKLCAATLLHASYASSILFPSWAHRMAVRSIGAS